MANFINDDIIERVRASNDIVEVISQYVVLKRTGSNFVGICPFHNENTPSFSVSPSKQIYHCFGCGEGGDVISFKMKIDNLSFTEAIKSLADRAGIVIEEKVNKKDIELEQRKEKMFEINREAANYFYKNLNSNIDALNYLKDRQIFRETIKLFGLGYSSNNWDEMYKYLTQKGYKESDIEQTGLIIKKRGKDGYYDRFRNRIMFPIVNLKGKVIGFGGRVLDSSKPKYLNSPESSIFYKGKNLFGVNLVNKYSDKKKVVLVEGYMDVLSLFNNGINYGVASLGTALTSEQARLIKRYGEDVFICYDSDEAGVKAANRAIDIFKKEGINAKVVLLPVGKDPDDFIKQNGKEKFEMLFDSALSYIDFKIYMYKRKFDLARLEDKILFSKSVAELLKALNSPIEIDAYIKRISGETGISEEAIKREVMGETINIGSKAILKDKYINNNNRNNKDKIIPVKLVLEPAHLLAEKSLIRIMIKDRKNFDKIKSYLIPSDFIDDECRELARIIYDIYNNEDHINAVSENDLIELLENINGIDMGKIKEILEMNINISLDEKNKAIEDLIETVKYSKLKIRRKEIAEEIHNIDSKKDKDEGDVERFKRLCLELVEIDKELKLHQ